MGSVWTAKQLQAQRGTKFAAEYLQRRGYSIKAALHILTPGVEFKG